jgi:RNA polymerase sigma factor (sigma-70 family)
LICKGTGLFNKISDKSIVEGIRNQDDKILNWLYDNYFLTVKQHVMKNSGTSADASDLFQDTIIVLYSRIRADSIELTSDLKGYFFGIARNLWNEHLRKKKETTEIDPDLVSVSDDNEEDDDPMFERIISRAFQKLKPEFRTVLSLYSEGCSYEEIAVKMNLKNENYARRKKYLCKEALMDLVREYPEYQEYLRFRK